MKPETMTNVLLLLIAALVIVLCIQNARVQKVAVYQNGSPVRTGVRPSRSRANPLPVRIVD
ncbi:hypothetical protein ACFLSJ_04055 [Verrucomicrobiota bacterium]